MKTHEYYIHQNPIRPFVCTYGNCGKSFKNLDHNLKTTQRYTKAEPTLKCAVIMACNELFYVTKQEIYKHRVSDHNGGKPRYT